MRKYLIICKDQIIKRGESGFYDDFRLLVPEGYEYVSAWNSPERMIINVHLVTEMCKIQDLTDRDNTNMAEWTKARRDYYRTTF